MNISQAVILAGGLNSRWIPFSKAVPKALLPFDRKPAIHYIVEECLDSGIDKILIVVKDQNSLIKKYFQSDPALLKRVISRRHFYDAKLLKEVSGWKKYIRFTSQPRAHGEAAAVATAETKINSKQPCGILFADLVYQNRVPAIKQITQKKSDRTLIYGNGRFVMSPEGWQYFGSGTRIAPSTLDSRIIDMIPPDQQRWYNIRGNKYNLGSPEEYHRSLCRWPIKKK